MNALETASLVNFLGFAVGIALYGLLVVMVVRHRQRNKKFPFDFLILMTAVLGFLWNIGEFIFLICKDFAAVQVSPFLLAVSYSALGFLPSVVVHSEWKNDESKNSNLRYLTFFAYGLSVFAAFLHFWSAIFQNVAPSRLALRVLTFGALAMLLGLLVLSFRQTVEKKAVWSGALLIFAVSALHLSSHTQESAWFVELIAHQSSLPLALAILLQDYRFAFADLFLKRAISLLLLAALAFGLYVLVAVPLLAWHERHDRNDAQAAIIVLALWIITALSYPSLHRLSVWFVDKVILRRVNFEKLQSEIAQNIEKLEDAESVLAEVCLQLRLALTAQSAQWQQIADRKTNLPMVNFAARNATIFVPTAEAPFYEIELKDLAGGRNLLSDEILMLESVAMLTARRIDALRVSHERCELELREQEFAKLATEAQLSALRAQINPHFLFNTLTTIGYLINTAPERAFETLMKLTRLLRRVLNSTGEFSTLGEEIKLIENYLDIEKARFEERLRVKIEVAKDLEKIRIPSLILQPLVENAIKHGISENKNGGEVSITANLESKDAEVFLKLRVCDTGSGKSFTKAKSSNGVGLKNIRERLNSYYGKKANLLVERTNSKLTRAEIILPVKTSKMF